MFAGGAGQELQWSMLFYWLVATKDTDLLLFTTFTTYKSSRRVCLVIMNKLCHQQQQQGRKKGACIKSVQIESVNLWIQYSGTFCKQFIKRLSKILFVFHVWQYNPYYDININIKKSDFKRILTYVFSCILLLENSVI